MALFKWRNDWIYWDMGTWGHGVDGAVYYMAYYGHLPVPHGSIFTTWMCPQFLSSATVRSCSQQISSGTITESKQEFGQYRPFFKLCKCGGSPKDVNIYHETYDNDEDEDDGDDDDDILRQSQLYIAVYSMTLQVSMSLTLKI